MKLRRSFEFKFNTFIQKWKLVVNTTYYYKLVCKAEHNVAHVNKSSSRL